MKNEWSGLIILSRDEKVSLRKYEIAVPKFTTLRFLNEK